MMSMCSQRKHRFFTKKERYSISIVTWDPTQDGAPMALMEPLMAILTLLNHPTFPCPVSSPPQLGRQHLEKDRPRVDD